MGLAPGVELFGRDDECRFISRLLSEVRRQRSGVLVLSGEPGVGKSALCAWAVAQASDLHVLSVQGIESEADLPFAALSELLPGALDRIGTLPPPQARALEGALARREAPVNDRFAIGAGVLSLLSFVGDGRAVLVVIDDAQWLDAASADALRFAARRLANEGVAMLVATRPGGAFDAVRSGFEVVTVRGLDASAAHAVLERAHPAVSSDVARMLIERSEGNPLALLEVPLTLSEAQLAGHEPIEEPLPVGPMLTRALLQRVSGLPEPTRRALLVAAASNSERVQPVLDALDASGIERGVLEAAEEAGVLVIAGGRLEFRHPLLRSSIYHGAAAPARRAAHGALAATTTGDARAWHLAQATVGEDESVAAALEEAGLEARHRGAPIAAAAALERAARLSPPGPGRVRRLSEAARAAHLAGRPAAALRLLDDAQARAPDALERAEIQQLRGRVLVFQGRIGVAHRMLVDEAARVRDADPERAVTMLAQVSVDSVLGANVARAVEVARQSFEIAATGGAGIQAYAGIMLATTLTISGERSEASALLDRFLPVLRLADPLTESGELISAAAQCAFWLERNGLAFELLDWLTTSAREASAPTALLLPLCCRAELDFRIGRWPVAAAQFQEAADLGEEMAGSAYAAYAFECLARLAAAAGDERACREHADRAMALIDAHHNEFGRLYVHAALGLLELGLGRPRAAIAMLELAQALASQNGFGEPNVVHWQGDLIEAHVRARAPQAARAALATLEQQAEQTGGHWARGTAARCRALLDEADDCFAAALEHFDRISARFEIARTHLCHGERLRRCGQRVAARNALHRAIEGFDELGAEPWAARAAAELRATGETPRRRRDSDRDELTAHELQVARIVANGASNREAAAALFLSPKTIEFHLGRIYRKLDVRTRTELARVAAGRGWLDPAPDV